MGRQSVSRQVTIAKIDEDRKMVFGVVYAPWEIDTHGEMMTAADVEHLCHAFMISKSMTGAIDTNHDNVPNGSYPIESFIARKNDPDGYPEGAWVLGSKVTDDALWQSIKKGEINGYSVEASVYKVEAEVDVYVTPHNVGKTAEAEGHTHLFFAEMDSSGKVVGGRTDTVDGHYHVISKASATDISEGHSHRFFV